MDLLHSKSSTSSMKYVVFMSILEQLCCIYICTCIAYIELGSEQSLVYRLVMSICLDFNTSIDHFILV